MYTENFRIMKTFQSIVSKFGCILLCTIIVSCSKSSESLPEPNPDLEPAEKEYKLASNVVELEGDLVKNVSSIRGDTLVYNSSTPTNEMPQVGDIILVSQSTEVFPYGFLGKVTEVSQDGNVITEAAALDEAFTYLNVEGTYELESEGYGSRVDVGDGSVHKLEGEVPFNLSLISGKLAWGLNAALGIRLNVDKRDGKNIRSGYVDIAWEDYLKLEANLDLEKRKDEDENDEVELGNGIRLGVINVGPIVLVPVLQPFVDYELEGEIEIGSEVVIRNKHKVRANFDGNGWSMIPLEKEEKTVDYHLKPDITIKGSAFYGVGLALEFRLFGIKDNNVSIAAQGGLEASGEITLSTETDDIYDKLAEDSVSLALKGGVGMGASAKIFFINYNWNHSLVNKTWWEQNFHLFPSFDDCVKDCTETEITASTALGRDLLWNSEVGIGLYDGEKFVEVSEPVSYKFEEDFKKKNPLKAVFSELTKDEIDNYTVWTYVKWGEQYVKCEKIGADIYGLWCDYDGWYGHFKIYEGGTIHYYNKKCGVWNWTYTRPCFWNKSDNRILIFDDVWETEPDEIWEIKELTSDSLVVLDLTEQFGDVTENYYEPQTYRFRRLKNHLECTVDHKGYRE